MPPRFSFFAFLFSLTVIHSSLFTPQRTTALRRSAILAETRRKQYGLPAPSGVEFCDKSIWENKSPSGAMLQRMSDPVASCENPAPTGPRIRRWAYVLTKYDPRWGSAGAGIRPPMGVCRCRNMAPDGGLLFTFRFSIFTHRYSFIAVHSQTNNSAPSERDIGRNSA